MDSSLSYLTLNRQIGLAREMTTIANNVANLATTGFRREGLVFAEYVQAAAPGAYVVKAFNTLNWATMVDPSSAGGPVSIPLVGDNARAKEKVAELVAAMGLEPIDVGPLRDARWVEGMLILWINNRWGSKRPSFDYHLRQN